ncbi:MAG: divergent polysaccharide deacetylase family protein [Acidobacteria bacterium]|nr:divergent polysaccharide deacetylase family protein [Acidobacteriota bacterium]
MQKRQAKGSNTENQFPRILFLLFLCMALLSAVGLDYMNWTRGKNSILFFTKTKPAPPDSGAPLEDIIRSRIADLGINPTKVKRFQESEQNFHLTIDLDPMDFERLSETLEQALVTGRASILKKEEYEEGAKRYVLWQVKGADDERLSLLFSFPTAEAPTEPEPASPGPQRKIAIIIDDMGYNRRSIDDAVAVNFPLTLAIIPFTPHARETAEIAHRNGLEVIMHLPLESVNENNSMNGIVLCGMEEPVVLSILNQDLDEVPYIRGVNNHMGSRATTDWTIMRIILERLKEKNLYFIDSMTTADSVAFKMARSLDVPSARRNVFLDVELNRDYILNQLKALFRHADRNGTAVGIGHPSEITLSVLKDHLQPLLKKHKSRLVFASEIVN